MGNQLIDAAFTSEDYDILSPEYSKKNDNPVLQRRKKTQNKLISISKYVLKHCERNKYDLHTHWNPGFITSLINPCKYNGFNVDWIGVRFGKTKEEIDQFKYLGDKYASEIEYGFQRHGCFQYTLYRDSFWVGIIHAVPDNAIDRYYMKQELLKPAYKNSVRQLFTSIYDKGYSFNIGEAHFDLSSSNKDDVVDFYKSNDKDGLYCTIGIGFLPDDDKIKSANIVATINNVISDLYPLYCKIVKRYY